MKVVLEILLLATLQRTVFLKTILAWMITLDKRGTIDPTVGSNHLQAYKTATANVFLCCLGTRLQKVPCVLKMPSICNIRETKMKWKRGKERQEKKQMGSWFDILFFPAILLFYLMQNTTEHK